MKVPGPFPIVINVLNGEGEFSPRMAKTPYLKKFRDGTVVVGTWLPYWARLRNEALAAYELLGLAKKWRALKVRKLTDREIADRLAVGRQKRRKDETFYHVPSEAAYHKAQDIFIRTLSGLVENWRESNWNLAACFQKYPKMKAQIEGFLRRDPLAILPAFQGASLVVRATQAFPRGKDKPIARARREATTLFIELVQHPDHERLGKCLRCRCFFFGRKGQKCCPRPRRCGSIMAAIEATKRSWQANRQRRLEQARALYVEWQRLKPRMSWKLWVADRIGVSSKWVTRAVNSGELAPPQDKYRTKTASMTTRSSLKKSTLRRRASQ